MERRVRERILSLTNAEDVHVDKVSDKQIYGAFELFDVKQCSFQVEKHRNELRAVNADIYLPVTDGITEQQVREFAFGTPDRCRIMPKYNKCHILYTNTEYEEYLNTVEKFDRKYKGEIL